MRNIILIGFMGTGKSAVSEKLAEKLGARLIDTDQEIEKESGMTISDIFKNYGEEYFRVLETGLLEKLSGTNDLVISCGGGIALREANRKLLDRLGFVVLLTAKVDTIMERLRGDETRPLIKGGNKDTIRVLMDERRKYYNAAAMCCVETDGLTVDEVSELILRREEGLC